MAEDAERLEAQAARIKGLRALARVSQLEAANAIGITPRGYQEWEAGGGISRENLKKAAKYFGSTPDYIEYGVVDRRPETPDPLAADTFQALARALAREPTNREIIERLERIEATLDYLKRAVDSGEILKGIEDLASRYAQQIGKRPPRSRRGTDRLEGPAADVA